MLKQKISNENDVLHKYHYNPYSEFFYNCSEFEAVCIYFR